MITIADIHLGNIQSIINAFKRVDIPVQVSSDPAEIEKARAIVLPGVGAFGDGMNELRARNLVECLKEQALVRKKPLLGICLGMQFLADSSDEHGHHQGLGLIAGEVVRLKPTAPEVRVPNIGWCSVKNRPGSRFFQSIPDGSDFYFVHSYHLKCKDPGIISATINYGGEEVAAALERDNIFGVQFHPEKSQDAGLELLHSFGRYLKG